MRLDRLKLKNGSCLEVQGESVCAKCVWFRANPNPFLQTLCKTLNEISDEPLLLSVWTSAVTGFPEQSALGRLFILELGRKCSEGFMGDFYP